MLYPLKHLQIPVTRSQIPFSEHSESSFLPFTFSATLTVGDERAVDVMTSSGKSPKLVPNSIKLTVPGALAQATETSEIGSDPAKVCLTVTLFAIVLRL